MSKLHRSYSFNPGSVYKVHPERVHILPPPEVTRMRTLPRPGSAKCRTTKQKIREPSPIRKLPLPEIFYNNPELEEKAELTDSDNDVRMWREEENLKRREEKNLKRQAWDLEQRRRAWQEEEQNLSSLPSDEEEEEKEVVDKREERRTGEYMEMVSRRAILHRSRDEMQTNLGVSPDQWFNKERLYKDHINEVLGKWQNIDDSIWAKVIILERSRRIAKAYARTPVLTINGSQDGFDGYRIGLNGFSNPLRDSNIEQVKEELGAGCKLKMDEGGNILIKRLDNNGVYVKNTAEETAVSNDILKLPSGLLEKDRPLKLFDMKKFQQNINREMKRQKPERNKLESQCISTIAFVRNEADLLGCPVWVMIINIVALEMLGDKMPIPECEKVSSSPTSYQIQTLKRTVNSSSDEDPYSLTGSSGYSGNCRDPGPYTPNIRATTRPDGRIKEEIYQDQPFYSTMARDSRREKQNIGDIGFEGEDPYYCGYKARITDFNPRALNNNNTMNKNKNKTDKNVMNRRNREHSREPVYESRTPWWHSRLYPDSGVDLSSTGSAGSPALKQKQELLARKEAQGNRRDDKDASLFQVFPGEPPSGGYLPGLLRNGGLALKTKELSSYQPDRRREYINSIRNHRTKLFRSAWD